MDEKYVDAALLKIDEFLERINRSYQIREDIERFLTETKEIIKSRSLVLEEMNSILRENEWEEEPDLEEMPDVLRAVFKESKEENKKNIAHGRSMAAEALDEILVRTPDVKLRKRLETFIDNLMYDDSRNAKGIAANILTAAQGASE